MHILMCSAYDFYDHVFSLQSLRPYIGDLCASLNTPLFEYLEGETRMSMELNYFEKRKKYLFREIGKLEKELKNYPPGKLAIYEYDGYIKWKVLGADNTTKPTPRDAQKMKIYDTIKPKSRNARKSKPPHAGTVKNLNRKKDRGEAIIMAQKTYKSLKLEDLKNELECIEKYMKNRRKKDWKSLLAPESHYRELLIDDYAWEYSEYNKKPDGKTPKKVKAPKGELVRSKSESMIAGCLYDSGIPYHYEEIHDFKGDIIAPDFTIKHPVTGQMYLWEHFGLAEKPKYQSSISYKIPLYINCGYIPGVNLITTYETDEFPLDIDKVKRIIAEYFM